MSQGAFDESPAISPEALQETMVAGEPFTVLDVRDRDEVDTWRIDGPAITFRQAPMMRFSAAEAKGTVDDLATELELEDPIIVVCGEGKASDHVASLLRSAGYEAHNLAGGMEAWARLYLGTDVDAEVAGIRQYHRPASGCCSYLITAGTEAVVVDPLRAFVDRYVEDAAELGVRITAAIDTHVHADHISGVRALAADTGASRILPTGALDRGLAFEAETIADGDELPVGDATIQARHAPGHTTEMTALEVGDVLLTGDSLFLHSVARPDLEDGADGARDLAATLYETLQAFRSRPSGTTVAPGHVGPAAAPEQTGAYVATLGTLTERLEVFDLAKAAFVDRIRTDLPPRPANYERIIDVNLGREGADASEAFELELGPNNCAVSA